MSKLELERIISAGTLIRTKFQKTEWISNVVYKVYDNYIQVELTQDYINSLIMLGDSVKCKCSISENEYLLDGIVFNIEIDGPKILTIEISNINKFQNVRKSDRYDTYIISKISINKNPPIFSIVTSLSTSGISVVSKKELLINTDAFVEIFVDSGKIVRFSGTIVRKNITESGFEYGIKLKQPDQQNEITLEQVLDQLKKKDESLLAKFIRQKSF